MRLLRIVACTFYLLLAFTGLISGQDIQPVDQKNKDFGQKDVSDLFRNNKKVKAVKDSTLNRNGPFISILPVVGYSLQSGVTGALVSNTSFYTDNSHRQFSNLLLNAYYSEYEQYWFTANTNLFFEKLKLHLYGDTRYYKFPTQTFGLGPNTSLSDALSIDYSYLRIYQLFLREVAPNFFAGAGYNLDHHWNIEVDSVPGKALNDFKKYQKGNHSTSSGISVNMMYDSRKNSANPDGGSYASVSYRPNLTLLGSDTNFQSLVIDLRHYVKLKPSSKNILSFWYYSNFTLKGTPPYLDTPSVGWDNYSNTGRGYVPGRFTGKNFAYLESEYRFGITKNGLLGGVVFANSESIFRRFSTKNKSIVPGGGLGLRIKVNKHSNTNLAIDYGFGEGGSHGLFFNLGEVF
jgi:hypothetical protein